MMESESVGILNRILAYLPLPSLTRSMCHHGYNLEMSYHGYNLEMCSEIISILVLVHDCIFVDSENGVSDLKDIKYNKEKYNKDKLISAQINAS